MIFPIGPKDKWEHDLQKLSRAALVEAVVEMQWKMQLHYQAFDREAMSALIAQSKKYGRWNNLAARHERLKADPEKFIAQSIRRSKAAKRAARRRKRSK